VEYTQTFRIHSFGGMDASGTVTIAACSVPRRTQCAPVTCGPTDHPPLPTRQPTRQPTTYPLPARPPAPQFGPALPILTYTTAEEALARANDSKFGLSGRCLFKYNVAFIRFQYLFVIRLQLPPPRRSCVHSGRFLALHPTLLLITSHILPRHYLLFALLCARHKSVLIHELR
jgi:hypothetical protein